MKRASGKMIALSIALLSGSLSPSHASDEAQAGPFPLNGQGFICEWLIAGPFPNAGTFPDFSGWDTDWLVNSGGETAADPMLNQPVEWNPPADARYGELQWQPRLLASEEDRIFDYIIDFQEFYGSRGREVRGVACISYAFCRLEASKDMDVILAVSSDDGCKLWLNGVELAANREFSSLDATTWKIPVRLKKGVNRLLVKVEEGGKSMHALQVRVLDTDGKPAPGVEVSL